MYGMTPSATMLEARERAARESVEHVEDAAALRLVQRLHRHRVDARHRDDDSSRNRISAPSVTTASS